MSGRRSDRMFTFSGPPLDPTTIGQVPLSPMEDADGPFTLRPHHRALADALAAGDFVQVVGRVHRPVIWYLMHSDPCDEVDHERVRPPVPVGEADAWYRGWEVGWDFSREYHTGAGYTAYKGGCDLGAPELTSGSWRGILDAVDDEEDQ